MLTFKEIEEGILRRRKREFQDYLERRERVLERIYVVKRRLREVDKRYFNGDLTRVAYLRERNWILMNPYEIEDVSGERGEVMDLSEGFMDFHKLSTLDEGYFMDRFTTQEYMERRRRLIEDYLEKLSECNIVRERQRYEEAIRDTQRLLLEDPIVKGDVEEKAQLRLYLDFSREEAEEEEVYEPTVPEYRWTRDPDRTVLLQRLLFLVTVVFGYFFVISPQVNYYSKLSTLVYFTVIVGGIYAYHYRKRTEYPDYEPYISLIIPVYNNEEMIYQVIKRHIQTDYPKDKLEIIVANDGSTDGTADEVRRVIMSYPQVYIKHLNYPVNQGKRRVIGKAFHEAAGEVIVRGDSDTMINIDGLRKIVAPLQDPLIKGVTGRIYVQNHTGNLLTRIQRVRYNYAFQQLYPFQNLLGGILCLPGCFSAYSREAIEPFIQEWAETKPSLSEDRQMAHLLLERGYRTMFVKDAVSQTKVPESLKAYVKQQLRWGKANLLQQLRATDFMYKKNSKIFLFYLITYFISLTTPYAILRILLINPNYLRWLTIVILASLGRGIVTEGLSLNALLAIPLFFFHFILDLFKMPLAMLTLSKED